MVDIYGGFRRIQTSPEIEFLALPAWVRGYSCELIRCASRPDGDLPRSLTGIARLLNAKPEEAPMLGDAIQTLLSVGFLEDTGNAYRIGGFRELNPSREYIPAWMRQAVIDRDDWVCGICRAPILGPFHLDHVVPCARGGGTSVNNLQMAHPFCNLSKGARSAD